MTIKFLNIKRWAAILPLIFVASVALGATTKYTSVAPEKYSSNANVVAQVMLVDAFTGKEVTDDEMPGYSDMVFELAAFDENEECRGTNVSKASPFGPRVGLTVQCNMDVQTHFRVVFTLNGCEYDVRTSNNKLIVSQVQIGTIDKPYVVAIDVVNIKPTQGYQTFFDSQQNYLLPPGLNGYTYSIDGSALTCNKSYDSESSFKPSGMEVKGAVLPMGTAAVLYTKSDAETITIVATEDKGYAPAAKSSLYGTDKDSVITAAEGEKHYILGVGSKGLGFYIAYDPKAEKHEFTNKAHKAYLYLDAQQAKMAPAMISLGIDEDGEADGIAAVLCDDTPAASSQPVNLLGIPVGDDYQGIVIINGKKQLRRSF